MLYPLNSIFLFRIENVHTILHIKFYWGKGKNITLVDEKAKFIGCVLANDQNGLRILTQWQVFEGKTFFFMYVNPVSKRVVSASGRRGKKQEAHDCPELGHRMQLMLDWTTYYLFLEINYDVMTNSHLMRS